MHEQQSPETTPARCEVRPRYDTPRPADLDTARARHVLEPHTEPLPRRVASGFGQIGLAMKSHSWKEAARRRVTPLQAHVLLILSRQRQRAATVSEITEQLAIAMPTTSEVLRVLGLRGLIKKARHKDDARKVTVTLTATGRRKAQEMAERPDFLAAAVATLPSTDQQALLRMVSEVIRMLQEQGDLPREQTQSRELRPVSAYPS